MVSARTREAAIGLLHHARFEVFPTPSVADAVQQALPAASEVTVTAAADKGLTPTLALSEQLAAAGFVVVPHLPARMIRDRSELMDILARIRAAGIDRIFVPGGDADPAVGDFPDALSVLQVLSELEDGPGRIGIGGYPESHPFIPDEVMTQALVDKQPHATEVVTNLCMDPRTVVSWVRALPARGFGLPVLVGMPGPVSRTKLVAMATHIGARDSVRFLAKNSRFFGRLLRPGGYAPSAYLERIATAAGDRGPVAGLHLYTFNQMEAVARWRHEELERLRER